MNILRKFYCRAFQTVFRIAIPLMPYRRPDIVDSVEDLPDVIKSHGCGNVLIVTDHTIRRLGLTEHLEHALKDAGVKRFVYDGTSANPTTDNVAEAYALYRELGCECLIGFGGGSSMDCAKAVGISVVRRGEPLDKFGGILKVRRRLPLLMAVPTTAGTGSETTVSSVITDSETRHKYAINDFPLIPRYAVLDPEVTRSLPRNVTATTGMDALTHAVEAYIGRSTTSDTRDDAVQAVKLIFANIDKACDNGHDMEARRNMLHASFLAGCAFTKSYVGYVHAVAHSLGGEYNVPHGLANATLLPFVLEAYDHAADRELYELAVAAGLVSENVPQAEGARKFIAAIRAMKKQLDIGDIIPEIREEDIEKLSRYADKEANPLYPVPVLMDAEELASFYYMVMEDAGRCSAKIS